MVVVSVMDQLVRKAEKRETLPPDMIELQTRADGKIARSLLHKSFPSGRWFVLPDRKVESGPISLSVKDFRAKRTIAVSLRLRLAIPAPGETAVEALAASSVMPKETIREWVNDLLQDEIDQHETQDFALWIALNSTALEAKVSALLQSKGFSAETKLETEDLPKSTIAVATEGFLVRPKDVQWSFSISVSLLLDHAGTASTKPPANDTDWRKTIKTLTKDYIQRHETLDGVRQIDAFPKRLEAHLAKACANFGWKVERAEFTSDLSEFNKGLSEVFETGWTSHSGRVFKFKTKVELMISATGAARYLNAGQPDLRRWTDDNLKSCFDSILFERDTNDLNPNNFSEIHEKLRQKLTAAADLAGLQLGVVLVEPAIPEWEYLTARKYELPPERFGTTNPDQDAVYSMVIEGKFGTVGPAFKAAEGSQSINQKIRETAVDAARLVMESTELEDYYSHFEEIDQDLSDRTLRTIPVLAELQRAISDRLESHLQFQVQSLTARRLDPDIREKLAKLGRELPREFTIHVLPEISNATGSRPKQFLVPFTLSAEFQQPTRRDVVNLAVREYDADRLWTQVEAWAQAALDGLSIDELRCDTPESKQNLLKRLDWEVGSRLAQRGVGIGFLKIARGNSEFEDMEIDQDIGAALEEHEHQKKLRDIQRKGELDHEKIKVEYKTNQLGALKDEIGKTVVKEDLSYEETNRAFDQASRKHKDVTRPKGISQNEEDPEANSGRSKKNQWSESE